MPHPQPLRYRGYIYDTETGLYYLQSRYYNPTIGRFINADSYAVTGQGLLGNNMFAYCLNNPISLVDHEGTKPGDYFDTPDDAARDFANCYYEESVAADKEYGSAIYGVLVPVTTEKLITMVLSIGGILIEVDVLITYTTYVEKYSYTTPNIGEAHSVTPNLLAGGVIVATIHTHGAESPGYVGETFSTDWFEDLFWANVFMMDAYLVTPKGLLKKYTYYNHHNEDKGISILPR